VVLQVEKMKEVAKLKAKEERKRLESEVSIGCTCPYKCVL
jgi:uncharacterized protein (UPF0254 family)